jgi:RNA polymerase sigma-70 factor (ECF subfamily)
VRDTVEFDEFYRGTGPRVLAYLYAVGGDLAEAQDAAQEAYARAWERWSKVQTYVDPELWVRSVGWRILANRWRRLQRRGDAYRRLGLPEPLPAVKEDAVALVAALRQLPTDQRVALVLFHLVDLPVVEIARQTGAPVGTVKARLSRGRAALATLLGADESETNNV